MTTPVDDDTLEEKEEGDEVPKPEAKPARLLWAIWGIFLLFALYTLGGIVTALLTDSVDPSIVQMPSEAKIEPVETPSPTPEAMPTAPIPYPYEEPEQVEESISGDAESPKAETPVTSEPEKQVPPAPEEETKTESVGPQSRIDWDATGQSDKPKIAIVIDDMGLNHRNSLRVVALPAGLTLAYLPYAENLPKQTADARKNGHELMVHMPMEPNDLARNNPGPNALLTNNSTEENLRRFEDNLKKFDGYMGINNHMGSAFTKNDAAVRPILMALKEKGLWFLDSKTVDSSVAGDIAAKIGIPSVERDVFLDNVADVGKILTQLKQTENIARKRGYAVAIGHPHNETIAALQQWTAGLEARGFEIVPLSEIIAARFPEAPIPEYAHAKKPLNDITPAAGTETAASHVFVPENLQ